MPDTHEMSKCHLVEIHASDNILSPAQSKSNGSEEETYETRQGGMQDNLAHT